MIVSLLPAAYAGPYGATQCAASRFGSNLGCTANDVSLNSITVAGTPPSSCVGGGTLLLNLNVTINFGSSSRYDIGVFLSNNGMDPAQTSATSCSVGILPTSSPFLNLDGDSCGDGNSSINGGTGSGSFLMSNVAVPCVTDGSGNTNLYIPYVISWDQLATNFCGDNTYPVPGTTSKCNKGSVTFPPGTTIIVLPAITKTDGRTTVRSGDTLTYTIVISSSTGSTVSGAVFNDPAVTDLSIGSIGCVAAGGATCPAGPTVSAMQGAGIALPDMPSASTLTFTVTGAYTGTPTSPTTLTNTASVTLSGQSNSASDTDTVMVPPTAAKSFNPAAIISGGTSTLTVTLTNPTTTVDITGAAFTDSYPVGMKNSSTPALTNSCGGTATAAAGGSSLTLSGATIPKGASCTVTVRVTTTTTGSNSTGAVTSANAASGSSASATLQVISATISSLVANPTSVANDGVSTSTITATLKDTAGNPVVGKTITLTAGSGSSIITTVNGTTDINGQATFTVKDSVAETVTYTARDSTDGITITQTASVTFSSISNFNVFESSTAANAIIGSIYTKLAGTAFSLDAVAIAGGNQASGFNGNVKLELLANTGTPGSGYGVNNCPSSNTVIQTIASAAIASGRSTVNFAAIPNAYRDVRVRISYPTTSPTITVCSTDSFAVRPLVFTISSTNATNTNTSGTPVIKTGANFNLTAASVAGYDGTPGIDNTKIAGSPTAGAIGGSFSAASPATGTAAGASFFYGEVGNFGLNANAVYDSSFTSVDQPNDCTAGFSNVLTGGKYGCSVGSNAVAQTSGTSGFGRFIPDNFNVSYLAPQFGTSCGTFTYVGQPFTYAISPALTVTARNGTNNGLANATTQNYAGAYNKFSDTAGTSLNQAPYNSQAGRYSRFDALGGGTTPALDTTGLPATTGDPVIGTFTNGVGTLTFGSGTGLLFTRSAATPNAPFNADIALALNVVDTDGVAFAGNPASFGTATSGNGMAFSGGNAIRYGRAHLQNAYGSELVALPMPLHAEYYTGATNGFVINTADACTSIALSQLTLSNATSPTSVSGTSAKTVGSASNSTTATIANTPFSAGDAGLSFSAPGVGGSGYVDVTVDLTATAWLHDDQANCSIPTDTCGRVTFGIFKGSPRQIYLREQF
ncbi:MAG: DUF6701 domain-containing protein [Sulfuricaulis sp.]